MEITSKATPDDVSNYLREKLNIPERFCEAFKENYIDGAEFLSLTREDIALFIQPAGIVKKILRHIQEIQTKHTSQDNEITVGVTVNSQHLDIISDSSTSLVLDSPHCDGHASVISTPKNSAANDIEGSSVTPSSASSTPPAVCSSLHGANNSIKIPTVWTAATLRCLNERRVTPAVRREIVHTLSVMMMASGPEATTRLQCERVANAIIAQYPFLADPFGKSQSGSWKLKLLECIRNREKYRKTLFAVHTDGSTSAKKKGSGTSKKARITNTVVDSGASSDEQSLREAMSKELTNVDVRVDVLKPLMTATFNSRRLIISGTPVAEMVQQYQALRLPAILEHEFALIVSDNDMKQKYTDNWLKWQEGIVNYCSDQGTNKKLSSILSKHDRVNNDKEVLTLQLLVALFLTKGNTFDGCFPLLYAEYDASVSMEEISTLYPKNNMPRIVKLGAMQFFILAEQDILTETNNLCDAIYLWFITHYVFNIEYEKALTNIGLFFQDNIFQLRDHTSRTPKYNSIIGDIRQSMQITAVN